MAGANRTVTLAGWWEILKRACAGAAEHNVSLIAAGVGFYALLAVFPALGVFVSLYGLFSNPASVQQQIDSITSLFPAEGIKLIDDQLHALIAAPPGKLSTGLVVSILLALFTARTGASALMGALNISYAVEERRGLIMQNLIAIGLTLGILVFLIVTLVLVAIVPAILALVGFESSTTWLAALARWPLLSLIFMVGLAGTYRFAPCRDERHWSAMSPGVLVAAALWVGASALFSLYVSEFSSYDKTYGSLGAVVILLMWFYISALAILMGAEINAATERYIKAHAARSRMPVGLRGL